MANAPRKPWLAGLLTFISVGLGHFYTGEPKRGVVLFLVGLVLLIVATACLLVPSFSLSIFFVFWVGSFYTAYCIVDVVKIVKQQGNEYELKSFNKWYYYLLFWFCTTGVFHPLTDLFVRSSLVEPYKIPSASMLPTLLVGDHLLTDKFIYKRAEPERGEIIIFSNPRNPKQNYIKRIIAVGGDTVQIVNKRVYLNNRLLREDYVIYQHPNILPGSVSPRDNFGPIRIPQGTVFVLGDNRDNADDSRYWGFVMAGEIKARAMSIYWSWDSRNLGTRWDRMGITLH